MRLINDRARPPNDRAAAPEQSRFGAFLAMAPVHRAFPPVLAAGVSLLVSMVVPLLGPLLIALLLGTLVANLPRIGASVTAGSDGANRLLLRAGVVLLGLKIVVGDILALGASGIAVLAVTVTVTFVATQIFGRMLGLSRELTTLVAAGFSICGAAAIAAVESSVRARSKDVALAVAMVTVLGSAMILVVPTLGDLFGLSADQTAVWAGASIHEVAQVIAAASLIGGGAAGVLALAITVKLGRVMLLAPVQIASARAFRVEGDRPAPPLFLFGFLAAVALRSAGVLPAWAIDVAGDATTVLLSAAMFGLGTGIVARTLWPIPPRVLVLASSATLVAAGTSLALVTLLV